MKKLIFSLLIISLQVTAAPVRFDFVFDDPNSSARTEGFIVFEDTLLPNPGDTTFVLPDPAVIDLQLTVTGSVNSDGTYNLSDYDEIDFWTNGGTLDFSQPLIGQATNGQPWGTTFDGSSGDFNLWSYGNGGVKSSGRYQGQGGGGPVGGPPTACFWFTICEPGGQGGNNNTATKGIGGGVSPMELQSMQPGRGTPVQSVPSLNVLSIMALATVILLMAVLFRRRLN